jgi:hypothetical protein
MIHKLYELVCYVTLEVLATLISHIVDNLIHLISL